MLLEDMSLAQVQRGQRDVFFAEKHGDYLEWKRFKFLKREYQIETPDLNATGPLGITSALRAQIVPSASTILSSSTILSRIWWLSTLRGYSQNDTASPQ